MDENETNEYINDAQEATNLWFSVKGTTGSHKGITIPIEALPFLRQHWRDKDGD